MTCPGQNANPGVELINVITPSYVSVVAHLKGNIICYHNPTDDAWNGFAFPIKPLPNGNMLASLTNIYTDNPNPQSVIRKVDLAGNTVTDGNGLRELDLATLNNYLLQLKTPKDTVVQTTYYHHDVLPLPNGHLILVVQQRMTVKAQTSGGCAGGSGRVLSTGVGLVGLRLPGCRAPSLGLPDWTHCNCVVQTPGGNLLLSSQAQSWVMKLDYAGGQGGWPHPVDAGLPRLIQLDRRWPIGLVLCPALPLHSFDRGPEHH